MDWAHWTLVAILALSAASLLAIAAGLGAISRMGRQLPPEAAGGDGDGQGY